MGAHRQSTLIMVLLALAIVPSAVFAQSARDYVTVVGSSTVYPFATVVAERFGRRTGLATPKIEATGSGGGFKQFCAGVGVSHPDISNSSRRIKATELSMCQRNGVDEVVEVLFGYDGIVLANASDAAPLSVTRTNLWLALAREVPDPLQPTRLIPNPYERWSDIDSSLPSIRITVLGPPPTSGTRDAFVELVMDYGCQQFSAIAALGPPESVEYRIGCQTIREDGAYIEAGESDNLIVQKLGTNPEAFGLFGFSFLIENSQIVTAAEIDGVAPSIEAIASRDYPVSRPLFLYLKKAHVDLVPGLAAFISEFTNERAWGEEGYLVDRGLVPLPPLERAAVLANVLALSPVVLQ
ncbi:MAG: substrate-binding domain-containing protein [Pseudomonadota bacterium]